MLGCGGEPHGCVSQHGMVEVTARFGDTLLEVAVVDRYVIGDAKDANLRLAGITPVTIDASTAEGVLRVGPIVVEVARVREPVVAVPRPHVEKRPIAYLSVSLAMHVALYIAATSTPVTRGEVDTSGMQKARLVATHSSTPLAHKADTDAPRLPTDKPGEDADDQDPVEAPVPMQIQETGEDPAEVALDDVDVPEQPTRERTETAPSQDTEPCSGRDCGIIKTGHYTTAPSNRGAGAEFELAPRRPVDVSVVGCRVGEGCKTAAGNDQADLRAAVERHLEAVMACFQRGDKKAIIDFTIDAGGAFERSSEPRTNDAAGCISQILEDVAFPRPPDGVPRRVTLAFARD